ncbi:Lipopolysaccharide assembly protein B [Streptomyces sp. enrichment culture]|uniref:tetratricopeptide repeat protein n=1 Tax=Streptomyces sp. enrichment culture TaxID=1795815 RepID=UPI003F55F4EE
MPPRTTDSTPGRRDGRPPSPDPEAGTGGPGSVPPSRPAARSEGATEGTPAAGATPDTGSDTASDTVAETASDTASDTVAETASGTAAETKTVTGTTSDTVAETAAETASDTTAETKTDTGTDTGTNTETDTGAGEGTGPYARRAGAGRDTGADDDRRVAVLRRAADRGRRRRAAHLAGCAALLAVALTGGAVAFGGAGEQGPRAAAVSAAGALSPGDLARGELDSAVTSLQRHLRAQPRDFGSWATLGVAYVEQARLKGDPSRYPQAERALRRSLSLRPGNDEALAGRAALAAARHDFPGALAYADRALEQNPYNERALCTRVDALVELGRYDDAAGAARTADDRRPGVPVFTRYAYVHELRGDVRTARDVLRRALDAASSPADVAYVATALGQLEWNQGDYEAALGHYARALAADDAYLPALEGRARAQAARGDRAAAVGGLEQVVARSPLPGPLVALGELYEARGGDGDRARARDQYALVDAWTSLARAGGVNADLDTALAAADHGDREAALRAARAEWDRRRSVHTADALAWALHVNGRDEEALPYARRATATGYRNAAFLHHRGIIERATGNERAAREHLTAALDLNPGFSPLGAREARAALDDLEGTR